MTAVEPASSGFTVVSGEERVDVDRLIVTADAWTNEIVAGLGWTVNLVVTQEQVAYFDAAPELGSMPVWIWMDDPAFYGLPDVDGSGVKIGQDVGGAKVTGDDRSFDPDPAYRERLIRFQEQLLPGTTGTIVEERTCLYTMTPDREFVLDHVPGHEGAVVGLGAAHGFKFAGVFGKVLAELAIDGITGHDVVGLAGDQADPHRARPGAVVSAVKPGPAVKSTGLKRATRWPSTGWSGCRCPTASSWRSPPTGPTPPAGSRSSSSRSPTARTTTATAVTGRPSRIWRSGVSPGFESTSGAPAPRTASPSGNTCPSSRTTTWRCWSGSPSSRGAPAGSGCGASRWGGFSALQTAMLRPPMLEAICAMHATHDRFATDVHYIGGALHLFEQVDWPVGMAAQNLLPPDPAIVGDRWMEMWLDRLAATPQWLVDWLEHQARDEFWRHGSPCEDYGSITAATLLIGGWLDPYVDGMLDLLAHLDAPRRAVIGPWGHHRPATGAPGPTLDHFDLLARWFGHWLADEDTGVMDDPLLTMYVRTGPPYDPVPGDVPGRWRAEPAWPLADGADLTLHLDHGTLTGDPPETPDLDLGRAVDAGDRQPVLGPVGRRLNRHRRSTTTGRWHGRPNRSTSRSRSWDGSRSP